MFLLRLTFLSLLLTCGQAKVATTARNAGAAESSLAKEEIESRLDGLQLRLQSAQEQITHLPLESSERAYLEEKISGFLAEVESIRAEFGENGNLSIAQEDLFLRLLAALEEKIDLIEASISGKQGGNKASESELEQLKNQLEEKDEELAEKSQTISDLTPPTSFTSSVTLSGTPATYSNAANLNVSVSGDENLAGYVFELLTGQADCGTANYPLSTFAGFNITISAGVDGSKILCVKGRDKYGNEQTTPTSYAWTQDTVAPLATYSGEPAEGSVAASLNVTVAGAGVSEYRYDLLSGVINCSSATYSAWQAVATAITESTGSDGLKLLCIEGRDLAGNIQSTPTNYSWTKGTPAGFVKIEKAVSGLAYEYFIMQYEASLESGSFGADSISNDGADLKRCNYEFHVNLDSFHASCGTKASTAVPQSVSGQAPIAGVTWHQAFATCRNLSSSAYLVRLATREEWLRAAKWTGSDYTAMWNTYTADCKVSGGTADTTGNSANCKNGLNLFDVAGNVAEWVDMRMLQYDIAANGEERFFYGPVIGNLIDNGIDGFTRRFHLIDPGAAGLALAMGANFATPTLADRKQYGDDVHAWLDPTSSPSSAGFRCVAFSKSNSPTLAELSLPSEPLYTAADLPAGNTANWKIPENLYENDTRYEELSIVVNGNTSDSAAEGEVTITWRPWSKEVCNDATCSAPQTLDNFTYRLYRFREPTHQSIRLATPWALSGGPYLTDENLDPLLASANNDLIAAISNCTTATAGNCTFTDNTTAGTSFSPTHYYRYLLVALDAGGNAMPAQVQRFHSPFFAGDPALAGAQSFRLEPRYRKAAVFLVDEEHQQAKAAPQIMVHVPMDKSGLDHDFFIQKYEGTLATGGVNNNATNANNPLSFDSGNGYSWLADAAKCHDKFLQTGGTIDATLCGTNSTIATVKSAQAFAPLVSIDQGAYWRACRKTSYADGDGNNYRLILPSSAEWNKAADWGDVDLDGTIDQHVVAARVGETIHGGVEYSGAGADAVTVRCHSDNNPGSPYNSNSAETTTCRSRYGMADHVGNIWEWVSDRHYSGAGLDNGLAGLWLDHATKTSNGQNSAPAGFDLLRGSVPADKTAGAEIASALNGDNYWYNTTLRGVFRGGRWSTAADAGRWSLYAAVAPSYVDTSFGGRCAVP